MCADKIQSLAKELNFVVRQQNGCRTFGPRREYLNTFRPPNGSEIFVGRLPKDAMDDEVYLHFSKVGPIYKVKMILNYDNTTKGYCFVEYMRPELALTAKITMNNICIRPNHILAVDISTDHRNLVVSNVNVEVTQQQIVQAVNMIRSNSLLSITPVAGEHNFLLEFTEHGHALVMLKELPRRVNWGPNVMIDWQPNERVKQRELRKQLIQLQRIQLQAAIPDMALVVPRPNIIPQICLSPDSGICSGTSSNDISPESACGDNSIVAGVLRGASIIQEAEREKRGASIIQEAKRDQRSSGQWYADYSSGFGRTLPDVFGGAKSGAQTNAPNTALKIDNHLPEAVKIKKTSRIPPGFENCNPPEGEDNQTCASSYYSAYFTTPIQQRKPFLQSNSQEQPFPRRLFPAKNSVPVKPEQILAKMDAYMANEYDNEESSAIKQEYLYSAKRTTTSHSNWPKADPTSYAGSFNYAKNSVPVKPEQILAKMDAYMANEYDNEESSAIKQEYLYSAKRTTTSHSNWPKADPTSYAGSFNDGKPDENISAATLSSQRDPDPTPGKGEEEAAAMNAIIGKMIQLRSENQNQENPEKRREAVARLNAMFDDLSYLYINKPDEAAEKM